MSNWDMIGYVMIGLSACLAGHPIWNEEDGFSVGNVVLQVALCTLWLHRNSI
jgi:hypothetical protein